MIHLRWGAKILPEPKHGYKRLLVASCENCGWKQQDNWSGVQLFHVTAHTRDCKRTPLTIKLAESYARLLVCSESDLDYKEGVSLSFTLALFTAGISLPDCFSDVVENRAKELTEEHDRLIVENFPVTVDGSEA